MSKVGHYFKTRMSHFKECWEHARQHRAVATILILGSVYVAYTELCELIEVPKWIKPESLPKIPPPWAFVIILGAILFVVVEGSYRLHHQYKDPSQPLALAGLPVYRQDVEVDLLAVCTGLRLVGSATVFMLLKTWAKKDLNLVGLNVLVSTSDGRYEASVFKNLSEWLLAEEFIDPRFDMKNSKETNLENDTLSLVREIESGIFREGHHRPKWVGCELSQTFIKDEEIVAVKLEFRDKAGVAKTEIFNEWPKTTYRVLNVEFRQR